MNISHGLERREREERDKVSEDIHQTLNLREREGVVMGMVYH